MKNDLNEAIEALESVYEKLEYLVAQALVPGGYGCIKKDLISEIEACLHDLKIIEENLKS